jgi:phosphoenolpyruvate carboxykinase (GTP)
VRGLHSTGELDPARRFIMHYPEELAIESFGSGYGGNALLGKKCHALRIASYQARTEGWLAEHMLIVGLQNPQGGNALRRGAFPSACGKTNLAMLIPPARCRAGRSSRSAMTSPGCTRAGWPAVGDQPGERLLRRRARHQPRKTNRNAYDMIRHDTIFTNVALTADNGAVVGRDARASRSSTGAAAPTIRPTARRRTRTRASRSRPRRTPATARLPMTRAACRSRR